jgi:hypothetical protein
LGSECRLHWATALLTSLETRLYWQKGECTMTDETKPEMTREEVRREMREKFDALNIESQHRHDGRRNVVAVKKVEDEPASPESAEQTAPDASTSTTPTTVDLQSSDSSTTGG